MDIQNKVVSESSNEAIKEETSKELNDVLEETPLEVKDAPKRSRATITFKYIVILVLLSLIITLLKGFVVTTVNVDGVSMSETLFDSEKVLVNKLDKSFERKDIIIFEPPDDHKSLYVKRIIGLPNDKLKVYNDKLYINDKLVKEPYVYRNNPIKTNFVTGDFDLNSITNLNKVPKGYYFVMGDNRLESNDSRFFGLISEKEIKGKVIANVTNLKDITLIK